MVLFPKSESSVEIKEFANQKQTENLTKSPTGMVIICFLKTGHMDTHGACLQIVDTQI